uniref:Auxin response factor n=1 Tax=Salvia miltiorrhiza TaxID=226208 RepID=A0A191T8T8_SALMI|nr:auxin response factor ARF19 [Salvia miltiorrhiza]
MWLLLLSGQPKRHLLTTGWSVFVSAKRLVAGDSVLFIWNDKNQLLLGIRRATRPQTVMPSSVLSSDSMHIGLLAAAAHAAATDSCFTVFYNPRASPSEFVIPLSKYVQAVYHTRVSVGMRFRMLFETEESSVRRYMGTITGIGDLDPVRWSNSHWRSVKVGWDESTAGDKQPRVSLWEIEPLTTFPMYPSLFPLRLKRPWYPGASSSQDLNHEHKLQVLCSSNGVTKHSSTPISVAGNEAINGMAWLRGEVGSQGFNSLNFQSVGMIPLMQQRFDPIGSRNDLTEQYQAMMAGGLQNFGSGELLKNQLMQFQQPIHYLSSTGSHNPVAQLQHGPQSLVSPHMHPTQSQMLPDNLQRPLEQQIDNQAEKREQEHTYREAYFSQHDQLQQRPMFDIPSSSISKSDFTTSNDKFSASVAHSTMQNMLSSICPEGGGNFLSFLRLGEPIINEQSPQQSWKFTQSPANGCSSSKTCAPFSGKDASVQLESCSLDVQTHALFGANIDSSASVVGTVHSDVQSGPSGCQSPLYGCVQDSFDVLQSTGELDRPNAHAFVKVYKTGAVGRTLDITQFNSYQELRQELGQMFGVEGLLEDPQRSGWQLVFVDRENDVLLLGDDPWEAFVNNVWYIKILSPEDVLKLGKQEAESSSRSTNDTMSTADEAQNCVWTPISRMA